MPPRRPWITGLVILGAMVLSNGCGSGRRPAGGSAANSAGFSSQGSRYSPQRFMIADGYSAEGPEAARLQARENLARAIRSEIEATFISVVTEVQGTQGDDEYRDEVFHRVETHTRFRHNQLIEVDQVLREGQLYVARAVASRQRLDQELSLDQRRSEGRAQAAVLRAEEAMAGQDLRAMASSTRALEQAATEVLDARIQRRAVAAGAVDLGYDPTPDLLRVAALGDKLRATAQVHLSTRLSPGTSPSVGIQVQSAARTCLQKLDVPSSDAAATIPCLGNREPHTPHFALQLRPTMVAKWGLLGWSCRLEVHGKLHRCGEPPPATWVKLCPDEPIHGHHANNEDAAIRRTLASLAPAHLAEGIRHLLEGEIPLS